MVTFLYMLRFLSMNLEDLKYSIVTNNLRVTLHADEELEKDNLTLRDILMSIESFEIIEDYPLSKPLPSCLILSFTINNEPVHTVWAYNNTTKRVILITVYRPDPVKWIEYKRRKK